MEYYPEGVVVMKFSKIIVIASVLLVISMLVPSCAPGTKEDTATSAPEGTGDSTPVQPDESPVKLTINGNDVSEYRIVYAASEYASLKSPKRVLRTEYDFYKLIANDISKRIETLTGFKPEVVSDEEEETDKEIIVGPSTRAESVNNGYDSMSVYKYLDNVQGSKLVIGAGHVSWDLNGKTVKAYTWSPTFHAFDAVEKYIRDERAAGKTEVELAADFSLSGKPAVRTVAMIGDSITAGVGSSNAETLAYPAILQRLLWQDYIIVNLGNSGKTMRDDLGDRYNATAQYRAALKNAAKFDLVTIMLGTNDSNRDRNWDTNDDNAYNRSALDLAKAIKDDGKKAAFMIMNCPAYYGNDEFGSEHVRELQAGLPALFEKKGYTCAFFDMYTFTDRELTKTMFPDNLHPNDPGHTLMAEKLATVIPQVFEGNMNPG